MVTAYNNSECRYRLDKLDKVVYLIGEEASKNIHIDNGEAYVDEIGEGVLSIKVYDIALRDTDELDERFKFTHELTFSVSGYANKSDFEGKFYAIVKTVEGVFWLVNPMFPCKVTYTYTLDGSGSHTDFTLSTVSNHPTLMIHGLEKTVPYTCGYDRCTLKSLMLNENKYSLKRGNNVIYTNDGFKEVVFDRNSASFTEQYDGSSVSHSISFNIKFDDYKSSWHYNLLEFAENVYAAIIETSCGKYVACGFGFGLNPSFSVSANDESTPDNIAIELTDVHDSGDLIMYSDEITVSKDGSTSWVYTNKYNGYECIGTYLARYLLKEEVDALMNPTGNYMVLVGYEPEFTFLNIIGTFTETEVFISYECANNCMMQTSFPIEFVFNTVGCRQYSVLCDSDWSITSSSDYITVTPSSGAAGVSYTVTVCNSLNPSLISVLSNIQVSYCNKVRTYRVTVRKGDDCLTAGAVFDISANEQYVTVPTYCCVKDIDNNGTILNNITIKDSYASIFVPRNESGSNRQFLLSAVFCNEEESEIIINQSNGFERWVKEGSVCVGNMSCDIERRYTGTTADDINTWTNETRQANCTEGSECKGTNTRWIDSSDTICHFGRKRVVQIEQVSTDSGSTWTNTGNKRLGDEDDDPSGECSHSEEFQEWRENGTICDDTTKYNRLQLYVSTDGIDWLATSTFKKGDTVIETDSVDCGYVPPAVYYEWREYSWECNGFDKYIKYRKYMSETGNEDDWHPTDIYKLGDTPIETNSVDCGYEVEYDYKWVLTNQTTCVGYDKYYLYKMQRRLKNTERPWEDVVPTVTSYNGDGTMQAVLAEADSSDCGYVPVIEPLYKWVTLDINSAYICANCEYTPTETPKAEYVVNEEGSASEYFMCDSNSTLVSSDYGSKDIVYIKVGGCVTEIGEGAFSGRTGLEEVLIPNTVTSIGNGAFSGCTSLVDFSIPMSITEIGDYAFKGDIQLNKIMLPNSLTSIGDGAFYGCKNFTTINIPDGMTIIPNECFYDCDGMTDIYLPESIAMIKTRAFANCSGLVNFTCYATEPPILYPDVFSNMNEHLKIYVPMSSVDAYKEAYGWSEYANNIVAIS